MVEWNRPVTGKYDDVTYTSKCGRYLIRKREYDMPTSHTAYQLYVDGKKETECDTLRDAKDMAVDLAKGEIDRVKLTTEQAINKAEAVLGYAEGSSSLMYGREADRVEMSTKDLLKLLALLPSV